MAAASPASSPLRRALNGTCPDCGQGKLFLGHLKVADTCEHCGLDLARYNAGDGPATLIFVYGAVIVPLLLCWKRCWHRRSGFMLLSGGGHAGPDHAKSETGKGDHDRLAISF